MQLPDRFGPIPTAVVLDGSGNGTVTFQPNGNNCRISNLFVKVATSTLQATCTMYKGQVADGNIVSNTNSGSTGAPAQGAIDLLDGETLYIVWRGGDAGAVATATFSGTTLPFEQVGPSHLTWADPLAAGDGSIIYPAFKSPNFSTGISGWKLDKDGNVEFNNGTFRGNLSAGGGVVTVSSSGVRVLDLAGNIEFLVNRTGGFVARNVPDNGEIIELVADTILFRSPTPTAVNGSNLQAGRVFQALAVAGASDIPILGLHSQTVVGRDESYIDLVGEESNGTRPKIRLDPTSDGTVNIEGGVTNLNAPLVTVNNDLLVGDRLVSTRTSMDFASVQLFTAGIGVAAGDIAKALGATNYPAAFPVGASIFGFANIIDTGGTTTQWHVRFIPVSNTQFNLILYRPAAGAASNMTIQIAAFVI